MSAPVIVMPRRPASVVRVARLAARRAALVAVGLVVAATVVAPSSHAAPGPVAWPQFRGDAAKTGFNPAEHRLSTVTVARLAEAWAVEDGALVGSPVLAGGTVYAAVLDTATGLTSHLVAVDAVTGAPRWSSPAPLGGNPVYPPGAIAVTGGRVLVVADGVLEGYAADDGALEWLYPVGASRGPTVAGGLVYVAANGVGSAGPAVLAIDPSTASRRWSAPLPEAAESVVAVAGGRVFAAAGETLFAFDQATGAERWHARVGSVYGGGPALSGDTVYVAANDASEGGGARITALDARTGAVRWTRVTGDDVHSVPAVDRGTVYVGTIDGVVHALSAATGRVRWEQRVDGEVWSSPTVAGGVVYVVTDTDRAAGLSAKTGAILWTAEPHGAGAFAAMGSPMVANGRLVVGYGQSGLRAYTIR